LPFLRVSGKELLRERPGLYRQEIGMKKLLRLLGWIVFLGLLVIAIGLGYSTAKGHSVWCFRVNGVVTVNGIRSNGYLHANTKRTFLFLTRMDENSPETYLVPLQGSDWIIDCGNWHPIRFMPVPMRDIDPPCSNYDTPSGVKDPPESRTLITSRRSVEFSTASGKKIRAEW
jgi:hypothetical protein